MPLYKYDGIGPSNQNGYARIKRLRFFFVCNGLKKKITSTTTTAAKM